MLTIVRKGAVSKMGGSIWFRPPHFLLRCVQLGISIAALDLLPIGLVNDMFTERQNDGYSYKELASQSDFDRF